MTRRTKATSIPKSVKETVCERDGGCCVLCGRPAPTDAPLAFSCAHVLRRSRGGMGIETNIVTLCPECHERFDGGDKGAWAVITAYMRGCYPGWEIEEQRYKKYG